MKEKNIYTGEYITEAINDLEKIYPDYSRLLKFYGDIFAKQEDFKKNITFNNLNISENDLAFKVKEQFPLIDSKEFIFDKDKITNLFKDLCHLISKSEGYLAQVADTLFNLLEEKKLDVSQLISAFLDNDDKFFQIKAQEYNIDVKALSFFSYNSVRPYLSSYAQVISHHLDKNTEWTRGCCPICGSLPSLSLFETNGERFFCCSFCWHKWVSKRVFCPFCENNDHKTLHYFEIENEEVHRIDICDNCKKYIKTTDTRKTTRSIYPPLEQIATPHLDIKIKEKGFENGIGANFW